MSAIHLYDYAHDAKIPSWEENKKAGYRAAKCGYQRKNVTHDKSVVTCKQCLRTMNTCK